MNNQLASPHASALATTEEILEEAKQGRMFILVDDEDRENEGDLIIPADIIKAEHINFMAKYGRGLICLTLTQKHVERLGLSLMPQRHASRFDTAFTVSIEAREGVTTGISANDRAQTIKMAVAPNAKPHDLVTPGHIFPVAARDGGVLVRAGHTEAAVDIPRLVGRVPAGVICEIMNDEGKMMRLPELCEFAKLHGLKIGTIADLIHYRMQHDHLVKPIHHCKKAPIAGFEDFSMTIYRNEVDNNEHIAFVKGDIHAQSACPVRMHGFRFFEDMIKSKDNPIHQALNRIRGLGAGVLVMICDSEPPSIIDALGLTGNEKQDRHLRQYGVGAQILLDIGVGRMILISDNRRNIVGLDGYGLSVDGWKPLKHNHKG